jgi:hypothetical protein
MVVKRKGKKTFKRTARSQEGCVGKNNHEWRKSRDKDKTMMKSITRA